MKHPELKPGDIGFAMGSTWISKALAWFMGSKWSHTFLVLDPDEKRTYLSETSSFEVWIGDLEDYDSEAGVKYEIWSPDISDEEREKIVEEAYKTNGETYGYLQFISLGLRCLFKKIGIIIPNFIRQGIVCCQHVMYGYTHSSVKTMSGVDPESMDTEDLYQMVVKSDRFTKVRERK